MCAGDTGELQPSRGPSQPTRDTWPANSSSPAFQCHFPLPIQGTWGWAGATWKGTSPASSGSWLREPAQHPELRPRFPTSLSLTKQPVQPYQRSKTCISEVFLHDKASHSTAPGPLLAARAVPCAFPPAPARTLSRWPPEAESHQRARSQPWRCSRGSESRKGVEVAARGWLLGPLSVCPGPARGQSPGPH